MRAGPLLRVRTGPLSPHLTRPAFNAGFCFNQNLGIRNGPDLVDGDIVRVRPLLRVGTGPLLHGSTGPLLRGRTGPLLRVRTGPLLRVRTDPLLAGEKGSFLIGFRNCKLHFACNNENNKIYDSRKANMKNRSLLPWMLIVFFALLTLTSCKAASPTPDVVNLELTSTVELPDVQATVIPTEVPVVETPVPPTNTDGAETVFIPGGVFNLGSNSSDTSALPHEMPEHQVTLSGFNIYTHEVTNSLYQTCVDDGTCLPVSAFRSDLTDYITNSAYSEYPVIGVDWHMANTYCEWANGRLPTEAEWEAAARGTDSRIYPWGDTTADCTNSMMLGCGKESIPYMVGGYADGNSPYEAWDMSGNTWEWVNDWYDANTYAGISTSNPYGPWDGDYKVIHGGGWNSTAQGVRSANRMGVDPSLSYRDLGFRCVANGFAAEPNISIPTEMHGHREGDGISVEDTPRTGTTPEETARTWSWGRLRADCGTGGVSLFSILARNSFGGSYSATVDGVTATCTYDAASGWLSCSFPSAPAGSGSAGSEFYEFIITLTDPSGTPLTDGSYIIGVGGRHFESCGSTGSSSSTRVSAFCGTDNQPYLRIIPTTPTNFTEVLAVNSSLSMTFSDPSASCTSSLTEVTCPLFNSSGDTMMGSTVSGYSQGTALDGITGLHAPFDGVSVPTCSATPTSESPRMQVESDCSVDGSPAFKMAADPVGSLMINDISDANGGSMSCRTTTGSEYECSSPPAGSDGLVRINLRGYRTSHPGEDYPIPQLVFSPTSCPGSPLRVDEWTFGNLYCRPEGEGGVITTVSYSGSASTITVNPRFGGTDSVCFPTTTDPFTVLCMFPVPLPSSLEFCFTKDGGSPTCMPSPYTSAHVPARCGGTSGSDVWNYSVGCRSRGTSGFDFEVTIAGGVNVTSLTANFSSGSVPCNGNPLLSNTFNCPFSLAAIGSTPTFHAVFADGSSADHVFDTFSSIIPSDCPGVDDPLTPGGGICEDNTSVTNWHNPATAEDVNNDGCVTPSDTLSLISRINGSGPGLLAIPRPLGAPFFDVNGDGSVTPLDVLITINTLNRHAGEPCTPTCTAPSSGDWSLEVICNSDVLHPGWIEFRAHFPGDRTDVTTLGPSYPGCGIGGDVSSGTISHYCPPDNDFSSPMTFWVRRDDGSISQHSFTNAASLAASCPTTGEVPVFNGEALCNTSTVGTYDLNFSWTPAAYSIYAIYDSTGAVISNCGMCSGGTCQCTGVAPGSDGLIHVQMDHREGSTETATPLTIVPPSCSSNDGWGISANCRTGAYSGTNVAEVSITSPASLHLTSAILSILKPGLLYCSDGTSNVIRCGFDLYITPRDPLEIDWPSSDGSWLSHTFSNFDSVLPLSCIPTPDDTDMNGIIYRCVSGNGMLNVYDTSWLGINSITLDGIAIDRSNCSNLGTNSVTCMVPLSYIGRSADVEIFGVNASGGDTSYDWGESYFLSCRSTPTPTPEPNIPPDCGSITDGGLCNITDGCHYEKVGGCVPD